MKREMLFVTAAALLAIPLSGCGADQSAETAAIPQPSTRPSAPPASQPVWGYEEADGPSHWGELSSEWTACAAGLSQSPIDIAGAAAADLPAAQADYKPTELKIVHHEHMADIVNTGHSIQVNYGPGDELALGDQRFELLQYHFHSPSEHTVDGQHFPMEMHLVHKSADDKLAVIGVLIEEGAEGTAFEPVWANLPGSKSVEYHLEHVTVDVDDLLPASTTTFRYVGSLTTPPCSEDVSWLVMTQPVQMSPTQIASFREVMYRNNRPTQPLNGRKVMTDAVVEK